jgi:hypothetical protein
MHLFNLEKEIKKVDILDNKQNLIFKTSTD